MPDPVTHLRIPDLARLPGNLRAAFDHPWAPARGPALLRVLHHYADDACLVHAAGPGYPDTSVVVPPGLGELVRADRGENTPVSRRRAPWRQPSLGLPMP